jgi:hypothetical protein
MEASMNFSFTLQVAGIDTHKDNYEDVLYEAGCDDALIAVVRNTLFLDFDREAGSYDEAVRSARRDIEKAGGRVIEASRLHDSSYS